ncbi:hypothetical protein N7449_001192 [Penicillium cf. viridicatum]|uniref:Uncharacterized protein n=1 Tax=Penicillium cf. viridicatum TaxID=2972119 RepID=A0A9W9T914_9EURO|nr:hypothetical protein N7449_001192 [Penicillium cf. viridicatum]
MASRMDVDSPNPNPPKRLGGRLSLAPSTKAQDPRLAGTVRQSVDPQSSNAQQAHLNLPAKPASTQKPPAKSLPQAPALSIPNGAPGPTPTENQSAPSRQGASLISDLVNLLIKANKCEEEKERLQKEIVSITKNLQRAKQSPQFPSVIALFQQQLDAAKDELANHVKSITQHRSLSNQAQDNFNSTLSQFKPQPQLENIPGRVEKLESTINGMGQGRGSTTNGDNRTQVDTETERFQTEMRGRDQNIAEINGKLEKVQHALENPKGLEEALEYIQKIANSVALQSKWKGQFTDKMSSLEVEVKAADKRLDDKIPIIKKMVDTVEEEVKVSNQQLETNISDLGCKLRTMNEQLQGKLSSIESDVKSLSTTRLSLKNSASTRVSQIEIDLEAQRKQATEQITAQENLLASLKTQQQNLDNSGRVSSETTPILHSGVLTRVVSLEKKVQNQADLLNNIKNLHHDVDVIRVGELNSLRQDQESRQRSLETKQNDTLRKVEDLTRKSEEMTEIQTTLDATLHQFGVSLSVNFEHIKKHVQSGLDGFETRLAPFSGLPQALTKCESKIESVSRAIRSLETRYSNITTGELVNSMAHAMQQMYPSVDQLSQQLTAYRTEIEARLSALKTDADAFKVVTESFKADTNQFKADTQKVQPSAEMSEAAQVSPEQLQNLTQMPILLQQVKDLSDKLAPIEILIKEHSDELQRNLELRSELQNKVTAQYDTIEGISEKADDQGVEIGNITESTRHISPLINKVDAHISQLQEVRQTVDELTKGAAKRDATASNNLDKIWIRLEKLESRSDLEDEVLDDLRGQLKGMERQNTTADRGLNEVRKKLQDLKDRNATEDNDFGKLRNQLKALEDRKPPVSLEKFNEQGDEVKMYIKRLRSAEDIFKALAGGAKISDVIGKMEGEESTDGQETPQPQPNGHAFTPRPTATPKTVPMGPTIGGYQPVQFSVKGQADNSTPTGSKSNQSATQARQSSQIPSGLSNSHPSPYSGKFVEPRQVQHLKGKRRVSSVIDSDDEKNTAESSSVLESSPAPSSSTPTSLTWGSSKKERKKAKKRAEQAEENHNASSRPDKKRKRNKQDG